MKITAEKLKELRKSSHYQAVLFEDADGNPAEITEELFRLNHWALNIGLLSKKLLNHGQKKAFDEMAAAAEAEYEKMIHEGDRVERVFGNGDSAAIYARLGVVGLLWKYRSKAYAKVLWDALQIGEEA